MTPTLHVITGPPPGQGPAGRLAIIDHPRTDAWPAEHLTELAGAGVHLLVSALTAAEQQRLGFGDTIAEASRMGLEFVPFPAAEGSPPREEAARVIGLSGRLAANVRAGRFVATQCFGGIGRSTLLASMTLVLLGVPPSDALRRVTGDAEMPVTQDWLHDFAAQRAPA
jgi:protein-tyrosine phosphatase